MNANTIIRQLRAMRNPRNVEGMARFGINPKNTLGVSIPASRKMAKQIGKDHTQKSCGIRRFMRRASWLR